jgi:hypothetical protein
MAWVLFMAEGDYIVVTHSEGTGGPQLHGLESRYDRAC